VTGHTPGPWTVVVAPTGVRRIYRARADGHGTYCYPLAQCRSDPKPADTSEADARLIAAAPELIAAMDDLAAFGILDPHPTDDGGEASECGAAQARRAARAAIAKARGQA